MTVDAAVVLVVVADTAAVAVAVLAAVLVAAAVALVPPVAELQHQNERCLQTTDDVMHPHPHRHHRRC